MIVHDELRPSDVAIDRELADIASNIRFLLDVTPINLIEARTAFLSEGTAPDFVYAPLGYDPAHVESRLAAIAIDTVEDATLAGIFASKRRELELQSRMSALPWQRRVPRAECAAVRPCQPRLVG